MAATKQGASEYVAGKVKYGPENWALVVECVGHALEYVATEQKNAELLAEAKWGEVSRWDPAGNANSMYDD